MSFDPATRLWERIEIGDLDECWPFTGARAGGRDGKTYGYASRGHGRSTYAHRLMFCFANGIDPDDLPREIVVRHQCDNPICCNPMHLLHGAQLENARDMVNRGRSLRGERATRVVLTEGQALEVFSRLEAGEMHKDIAALFGVSRAAISQIARGANWRWLRERYTEQQDAA